MPLREVVTIELCDHRRRDSHLLPSSDPNLSPTERCPGGRVLSDAEALRALLSDGDEPKVEEHIYTTWDAAIAAGNVTDEADGWPDSRIVPVVELLRARGVTTLQSCSGHLGEPKGHGMWDGHLWIVADCPPPPVGSPFARVELALWPPPARWVLGWTPDALSEVVVLLDDWSSAMLDLEGDS